YRHPLGISPSTPAEPGTRPARRICPPAPHSAEAIVKMARAAGYAHLVQNRSRPQPGTGMNTASLTRRPTTALSTQFSGTHRSREIVETATSTMVLGVKPLS